MNKFIICLLLIICISCNKDNNQALETIKKEKNIALADNFRDHSPTPSNESPYEIKLQIDKLNKDAYNLVVNMLLEKGAYYVSPHAKRDFKGKFKIFIAPNDKLFVDSFLIETPQSVEEYDSHPFVNGLVNWVRISTTYKQQLNVMSEDDFNVSGFIQFTIEPRCTLEKIPFIIVHNKGELKIKLDGC